MMEAQMQIYFAEIVLENLTSQKMAKSLLGKNGNIQVETNV